MVSGQICPRVPEASLDTGPEGGREARQAGVQGGTGHTLPNSVAFLVITAQALGYSSA